jgi:hypothetical protein
MADEVKIGFVIDGTEYTIEQLKEMAEAAKEVGEKTEEANEKIEKSSKKANKEVGLIGKSFTGLKDLAKGLKADFMNGFNAVKQFAQGLGMSEKASKGLAVGLSALGIPIILMAIAALVEYFKNFEAGVKLVTTALNIAGNVIGNITEAFSKLAKLDFGGFFSQLGKTGKVIKDTVNDTNALFEAEKRLSEMNAQLATENAKLQAEFDRQSDIIADTTKTFEEREAAMKAMNAAEEQLMANAVEVAKLEKQRLQAQINLENNFKKRRELTEQLAQVEAGLITEEAKLVRQRKRSEMELTKLRQERQKSEEADAAKALEIRRKFFEQLTTLEQKNELAQIQDLRKREERKLEIERDNQIRSIRQSEFSENEKARLIGAINKNFRLSLQELNDGFDKEDEQREKDYQARLLAIRNEVAVLQEEDARKRRELQLKQQEEAALREIEDLENNEELKLEIERKFALQRQQMRDEFEEQDRLKRVENVEQEVEQALERLEILDNVSIQERQKRLAEANAFFDQLLTNEDLNNEERIKLEKQRAEVIAQINQDIAQSQMAAVDAVASTFAAVGSILEEGSQGAKAFAILDAVINTYKAANVALGSAPPPFNFALAAANVAAGIANVNKIKNSSVGTSTVSASVPSPANISGIADMAQGATLTRLQQEEQSLVRNRDQEQVVKAFVVAQDVTDNQAANKKIKDLSRL